ncbi:MAG TPA: rhodanese-like domain-containing protein [Pyrinomonadaceae bacterium]|jgi:rhodanese-related sulfurtransferase
MDFKKLGVWVCAVFLASFAMATVGTNNVAAFTRGDLAQQNPPQTEFITAEELKAKLAKNEPVTIIDVRGSAGSLNSDSKIKGAVYVKLRRLKYRLGFAPLKDVPRNRQVVTYCACPNDESGIRAAQILREAGFNNVRVLKGGWVVWKKVNGQVEPMARGM